MHLGSALLFWGQNSTKPRLKDKPSQTTNQCWLFLLSAVLLCLGGGRGMASLVSAPVHREDHHLLKGKGWRMCHLAQSRGKKALLKTAVVITLITAEKIYTGQMNKTQLWFFSKHLQYLLFAVTACGEYFCGWQLDGHRLWF